MSGLPRLLCCAGVCRWHCARCADFDLCDACVGLPEHAAHVANHAFLHIQVPLSRPLALLPDALLFGQVCVRVCTCTQLCVRVSCMCCGRVYCRHCVQLRV